MHAQGPSGAKYPHTSFLAWDAINLRPRALFGRWPDKLQKGTLWLRLKLETKSIGANKEKKMKMDNKNQNAHFL